MMSNTGQAAPQYGLSQQQHQPTTSMGRALQPSNLQQTSISLMPRIDSLIKTLSDACQRDDLRLKALQEISNSFEEVSVTNAYHSLISNLLTAFMKIFQDTVPQFISENNTQQLRKLMLEIILRMACNETVKQFAKTIQPQLVESIISENEENSLIAMKIMVEYMRGFRLPFCPEVSRLLSHFKSMYQNIPHHVSARRMFEQRSQISHTGTSTNSEESIIESSLQCCYTHTIVYLSESNPDGVQPSGYSLIPRASQSIKVLAEIPTFLLTLCQLHRHNIKNELTEFVPLIIQFVNLSIPTDQRASQIFSISLAEEFYNSQVRALSFLGIMAKTTAFNMSEVMNRHSASLIQGIVHLMERCPNDTLAMRRELIATAKNFFQCDMRTKFISILPRLFNENLLLGTGFTVVDNMRTILYTILADLVHHLRTNLSYNFLCCSVYTFVRSIHDQSLPPYVQAMCCKLVMNLIDSFVVIEKEHSEQPGRDILLWIMESYVRKFRVLAEYHVPMLIAKDAANISDIRLKTDEKLLQTPSINFSSGNTKNDERGRKLLADSFGRGVDLLKEVSFSHSEVTVGEIEIDDAPDPETLKESVMVNNCEDASAITSQTVKCCRSMLPPPTKVGKFSSPSEILTQYWALSAPPMTFHDAKSILRVLAQACKHTVHGLNKTHITNLSPSSMHEAKLMEQLFFYGLKCLDIYVLSPLYPGVFVSSSGVQKPGFNGYRSKDEKEVLECFAGIFTALNPTMFKEIFSKYIEFFIQRISRNPSLYLICNAFLVAPSTSAKCADVLIRYLMKKLPELSENNDVTSLYLKLFKLVFSSISCCQPSGNGCAEVERMLQPYLHDMVYESMELALRGREPVNYLLLLRGLFRSIGGGNYDLLYQAFLPLLPTLLQQINRLQSSAHRQQMKEIFVELCLTVPVRLSALLPFLPLLMDPLVCALNGSPPIVSQGLRTLELCVDNLQPEYLYEHMTPVRAQLMHGLWRAVSSGDSGTHPRAFKILCKFGGSNRKMLSDSQELNYKTSFTSEYPAFEMVFLRTLSTAFASDDPLFQAGGNEPLHCVLSVSELVASALENLRSPFVMDPSVSVCASPMQASMRINLSLRRHSYNVVRSVILGSFMPSNSNVLENVYLQKHLLNELEAVRNDPAFYSHAPFKCTNAESRSLYIDAVCGLFYAVVSRDLRDEVVVFFKSIIRQLTIQAVFDYRTGSPAMSRKDLSECMDGFVIVDVLMKVFADPCKEISQSAIQALNLIRDTLKILYGDKEKALQAPLFCEVFRQSLSLCYTDVWYARLGGCLAINYFLVNGSKRMIKGIAHDTLSALFEVIIGLSDEVSSSVVDMSVTAIEKLIELCFQDNQNGEERNTLANVFIKLAIKHLAAPSPVLRLECRKLLSKLSMILEVTLNELLFEHKASIENKMQSGFSDFVRMSLFHQMAFLESFEYVYSMEPPLLQLSFCSSDELKFINELICICDVDDSTLLKKNNYQPSRFVEVSALGGISSASVIQFREITIRAALTCYIAACSAFACVQQAVNSEKHVTTVTVNDRSNVEISNYQNNMTNTSCDFELTALQEKLFSILLKFIKSPNSKLQSAAFEALKNSELKVPLRVDLVRKHLNPLLVQFNDAIYAPISSQVASQLQYYMRLSFDAFDRDFADKLEAHMRIKSTITQEVTLDDINSALIMCEIIAEMPTVGSQFIEILTFMFCRWEALLVFDTAVNWKYPLLKYLVRYPLEAVRFFTLEECISDEGVRELFKEIVNHKEANSIREVLMNDNSYFFHLLHGETARRDNTWSKSSLHLCDMELLALKLIASVGKRHANWAANGSVNIVKRIQTLWTDKDFRARYVAKDFIEEPRFEVPKLAALIMLRYFRANIDDMELLYDLCFVFLNQFTSDFSFFRLFIEREIIPNYSIEWRQNALKFVVRKFEEDLLSAQNENIVKMLHYIIIPCLHYAFERYDVDLVVGTPANPDVPDDNNLVSLMCHKVMNRSKFQMSDSMLIALFHLGCLFVSNCPAHIHNFAQKKQGDRLRILMLLGWPCLSPQQQQDQTTRYMGHLLIAHIIDQFNINRKIVLQVFHSLLRAYHTDPRDVVKKSLDVLTPAMPKRVDDGCKQMMTFVKKTILEEGHNGPQVYHCLSLVVRHYKIYYNVRHYMIQFLMNAIHRLVTMQGSIENRRIAIDVCEMVIKWEQLRLKNLEEAGIQTEDGFDGNADVLLGGSSGATMPASGLNRSLIDPGTNTAASLGHSNISALSRHDDDEVNKPIEKVYIDNVTTLLLKMAINVPDSTNAQQVAALEQLNKRSLGLLKACLKPNMWGHKATIRIQWLEKQLITSVDPAILQQHRDSQTFLTHVSLQAQAIVDLYSQLVNMLPTEKMLLNMKQAQRGIVACLASQQTGVLRSFYQLIAKLMEKTKSTGEGLVELGIVNQFIAKNQAQPVTTIYPAINILRTMCGSQPAYVDTVCLSSFLKAIQRLVKDHIASSTKGENKVVPALAELIIYSLELLRPRVHALSAEARRNIALCILQPLIEKAQIDRVLEVVLKMVNELVKTGDEKHPNQGVPLLIRLTQAFESQNRHKTGSEMLLYLLKIVLYVYECPILRSTDAVVKLSNAFHWGLSVQDEETRNRFFKVFDAQVSRRVYERLYHIVALQNWGDMHDSFWIKHCINLMLFSIIEEKKEMDKPYPTKLVNCATFWHSFEACFRLDALPSKMSDVEQNSDVFSVDCKTMEMDLSTNVEESSNLSPVVSNARESAQEKIAAAAEVEITDLTNEEPELTAEALIKKQSELLFEASRFRVTDVISSIIELIHSDSELASKVWIKLFTSLWSGLTTYERGSLEAEMMPFLVSGCHISQQNCSCSSLTTFMEAIYRCDPPVKFQPNVVRYVSANHHAWHRGIMLLENDILSMPKMLGNEQILELFPSPHFVHQLATMDSLKELYEELDEEDQLEALWNRRAYYEGTTNAISLCNQGRYEMALQCVSSLMDSTSERLCSGVEYTNTLTAALYAEYEEWQKIWVKSTRELGRWEDLRDFANSQSVQDLGLLAESSWHIPEWNLFGECLVQLEGCTPPQLFFDVSLYKAMHLVIHPSLYEEESDKLKVRIKKLLEDCNDELMKKWERLPKVVSHSHINILQSANRVEEVGEASTLSVNVLLANSRQAQHSNILSEVKSLMKTWRNRSPTLADNYSHWMDIHHWRIHHFAATVKLLRRWETFPSSQIQHTHMALHTAAVSEEQLARAARQCGLFNVAQESLNRLHTLPAVLPADADSRVTEHIKCMIKKASEFNITHGEEESALREALAVTENVKLNVLNKEHVSKIFSLKGVVLSRLGKIEEANCAFSAAATLSEPNSVKNSVWSRWGEHLEKVFFANSCEDSALDYGINALSCILEGARIDNEEKTRKYISRFFWLLRCMSCHGEVVCSKMYAVVEKFACEIPPLNWLYWLPQLISELRQRPSRAIAAIISYVGENFEQQTFCAIRSATIATEINRAVNEAFRIKQDLSLPNEGTFEEYILKIVMQLCYSKPPDILALNRIFIELDAMGESWLEQTINILNEFRDRILKYVYLMENRDDVATAILPNDIETDLSQWIELLSNQKNSKNNAEFIRSCSEPFSSELSFTSPSKRRVLRVIAILNNWITLLNSRLDDLPKKRMLQDVSPFLASYTCKVANVEMLGEVISSKTKQYSAYIARFMPVYHIVRRGGVLCQRITIRALNGKETCRRFLQFVTRRTVYFGTFTLLECPNKSDDYYSFIGILDEMIKNQSQLQSSADVILRYYSMLTDEKTSFSKSQYVNAYTKCCSSSMVSSDMLSKWFYKHYDNPTHLFTLRKQLALQLSLLCISEYLFDLKALMLEHMDLDLSTGQLSYADFDFCFNTFEKSVEHSKVVPFRLTPNLVRFLGMSLDGHYKCAAIAITHCFLHQNVTLYLRCLMWDALNDQKCHKLSANNLREGINGIIDGIQKRLLDTASDPVYQINELMRSAQSVEKLALMDPCWHPWF
uniref:Non-specific serine/threonine protein kinase n=1 Tax=Syphacia muris TaxID=451379 RepID=A0A0N5ASH3_9BILA